jgi:aryl-alcohol dehydrogenase-like predicted oxidoreductase
MSTVRNLNNDFTLPGTTLTLKRMGYGTMQLPGPHVMGPPLDKDNALEVLREAVVLGANHIDTAEFYGPHVSNELIYEALSPYNDDLVVITKVGVERGDDGSWNFDCSKAGLIEQVNENLTSLGVDALDVVNLRLGNAEGADNRSLAEPLNALVELQKQGLIRHIGLSCVSPAQYDEAVTIANIVCVQNQYNLIYRHDDELIDRLAKEGVAYVPFFPLGGFSPLQSSILSDVANEVGATAKQVALAWLLHRSPNILVIAGTSSIEHLHENFGSMNVQLSSEQLMKLNNIADK